MAKFRAILGHLGDPNRSKVIVINDADLPNSLEKVQAIGVDKFVTVTSKPLTFLEQQVIDDDPDHLFEQLLEEEALNAKLLTNRKGAVAGAYENRKRGKHRRDT